MTVKLSLMILARAIAAPLMALYRISRRLGAADALFASITQVLSLVPGKSGTYLRAAFLSLSLPTVAKDVSVGFLTTFSHSDTTIEPGVYIGSHGNIGKCQIGRFCLLGSGVHVLSGKHQHGFSNPDVPIRDQPGTFQKITIGENCWVGNQAVIMSNIGNNCIVAAGSVVVDDIPEGSIVAGNPARVVRHLDKAS